MTQANHAIFGRPMGSPAPQGFEEVVLGMGCYWGVERLFWEQDGVWLTEVGFAGGTAANPTYRQVCNGGTGHAEVVLVVYDPAVIGFDRLLAAFWESHDPTQGMRQGNDLGTQYRSAVFAHDEAEARFFADEIARAQANYDSPIVTRVEPASAWHPAEDIHQDFYARRRSNGYCRVVIDPKLAKVRRNYSAWLVDA